jgi:hypothetical protein
MILTVKRKNYLINKQMFVGKVAGKVNANLLLVPEMERMLKVNLMISN